MASSLAARYLLLYNTVMTAGWLVVLLRLARAVLHASDVYDAVHVPLKIFQTGAVLEVAHAATGLVRTSAATTGVQVASRVTLVWGVAHAVADVRTNVSFTTMVCAWALTEIPRYFYFSVAAIMTDVPFWLTVTRYSTFLPLYPVGASSEWLTMYAALPHIRAHRLFSVDLPNRLNFAFDYHLFCIVALLTYLPGLPFMYSHMLRQRRKYVSRPSGQAAQQKAVKTQ